MVSPVGTAFFTSAFLLKNTHLIQGAYAYLTTKGTPVPEDPEYTSNDVSVIIPTTFKDPMELTLCIQRILENNPAAIYVVTANACVEVVEDLCAVEEFGPIVKVLGVDKLNKRAQILKAMEHVDTKITILADDDVFWPDKFLPLMLAIFEDPKVGAGGPRQRVKRNETPDAWNMLGIAYLERRVWNNVATNSVDGSISTLSGRTAAYRSEILQDEEFAHYFLNDTWRGKPLNSDDDKCLTRYVYAHGWDIKLQFDPRATIETTVEGDAKYLKQCMRWARAHWRGNWTVIENETYWRSKKYFWGCFYIYFGSFLTPSILVDGVQQCLLLWALWGEPVKVILLSMLGLACWILFTKNLKMIPHFCKYPQDMQYIPALVLFSYYHGYLNIRAARTMTHTHWGSQNLEQLEQTVSTTEATTEAGTDMGTEEMEETTPLLSRKSAEAGLSAEEPTPRRVPEVETLVRCKSFLY